MVTWLILNHFWTASCLYELLCPHISVSLYVRIMVFILYGCSFHVAHVWCKQGLFREKNRIWWLFRCNQMPSTNRDACFTPCVRIGKWATIYYKNHGPIPDIHHTMTIIYFLFHRLIIGSNPDPAIFNWGQSYIDKYLSRTYIWSQCSGVSV